LAHSKAGREPDGESTTWIGRIHDRPMSSSQVEQEGRTVETRTLEEDDRGDDSDRESDTALDDEVGHLREAIGLINSRFPYAPTNFPSISSTHASIELHSKVSHH
jgi:hypothetical protein